MSSIISSLGRIFFHGKQKACRYVAAACWLLAVTASPAAPLMEEGFNYPTGTALTANPPWAGSSGSFVGLVGGNLTLTDLRGTMPSGNMLHIGGGAVSAYCNFSDTPVVSVAGGAVYGSALISCTVLPTNAQNLASLLVSGATSFNGSDDPLALYALNAGGGYTFRIAHHGEIATVGKVLTANTTHLIVFKYLFGGSDQCALFIDPTPGLPEPAPDAITVSGEGDPFSNLQVIGLKSPALASQGSWNLDALRIGTNWEDVTPLPVSVSVTGPDDQAICSGSAAAFSVTNSGTPPFSYQWQTNGTDVFGATNLSYTLSTPGASDTASTYDVVVHDAFGSITSRVATLSISSVAPGITTPPADQIVPAGAPGAAFNVRAAGDEPLRYQWRVNGIAIEGETNSSLILANPGPSDALNAYDVLVANPCGMVTSSPPATVIFPHPFFGCDALPGFFSGMNFFATNASGVSMFTWSSPDPSQPITTWALEGPMFEQPLNDGTGTSRYSINVNPAVSPVYYVIGTTTTGPYVLPVPVQWLTTDAAGFFYFYTTNLDISHTGELQFPTAPKITRQPISQTAMLGKTVSYSASASGTEPLSYHWYFDASSQPVNATNASLVVANVTTDNAGAYFAIVTNAYGAVTSNIVNLTVVPPPGLNIQFAAGVLQLSAVGVAGDVYCVQAATNLVPPVTWVAVATNVVGGSGAIIFSEAVPITSPQKFYRLVWP